MKALRAIESNRTFWSTQRTETSLCKKEGPFRHFTVLFSFVIEKSKSTVAVFLVKSVFFENWLPLEVLQ